MSGGDIQFGIRITADGKVAITEAGAVAKSIDAVGAAGEQTATKLDSIGKSTEQLVPKLGKTREGLESISQGVKLLTKLNIGTLGINLALEAVKSLRDSLLNLPRLGREFAASMETNQLGMAGILSSMTQVGGKALEFSRAMTISADMMAKLNQDAIRTAASTEELVNAYRALLGPGMAANMSLEQIRQLTVTGVNAVKAMGLPAQQVVQELRDLVAGGITAASSTLATALGLRDEDIAKAKASAEGLYSFLMKRLAGFSEAADKYSETISGVASAFQERLTLSAATGFSSLTQAGKEAMQKLTTFVSSKEFINALKSISDAVVYLGFMLKAAFDIAKEFLLPGALVAGGYAIATSIGAIHAAALAAGGSMALLNKETLLFVTGAGMQRLQTLSAGTKGGLIGFALWGGWEIGEYLNRNWEIQKSVDRIFDPIFRFFDRSDVAMLEKLQQKLKDLQSGMKMTGALAFDQVMPEKERLAAIVETERKIAEIRARMNTGTTQGGAAKAAADLSQKVDIAEKAYEKLVGTTKTAGNIEKEYTKDLTASRKAYMELLSAKNEAGASEKELLALAKTQEQFETAIAKKRSDELRALGRESRAVMLARIDDTLKLKEIELKAAGDHVKALNTLGQLSDSQAVVEQARLTEEKISAEILAARKKLTGASKEEAAKLNASISELDAQRVANHQKTQDDLLVIDDKAARDETARRADEAKQRGDMEAAFTLDFIAKNGLAMKKAYADNNQELIAQIQATFDAGINQTHFDAAKQEFDALFATLKAKLEAVRQEAERDGGWLAGIRASQKADEIRAGLIPQLDALGQKMESLAGTNLVDRKMVTDSVAQVKKLAEEVDPIWKSAVGRFDSNFHDVFLKMTERGKNAWKAFCDALSNTFKTTVADAAYQFFARPFVFSAVASVAGSMGMSGMANAASTIGGGGSIASTLGGASLLSGLPSIGTAVGNLGTVLPTFSTMMSTGATVMESASAAMAGMGSSLLAVAPYAAAALVIANAIGLFGKGGGPQQGQYGSVSASGYSPSYTMSGGDTLGAQSLATSVYQQVAALYAAAGKQMAGVSINQGYKLDPAGTSAGSAYRWVYDANGNMISSRNASLGNADASGAANLLGALNSSELMDLIHAIADPKLTSAAESLATNFGDLATALPKYLTAQAVQRSLVESVKSEAEKLADARTALAAAGLPQTAEEFKAIASGIDITTQAGQDQLATMVALKSSLDLVTRAAATTTNTVTEAARSLADIANERNSLQAEYDSLTMTSAQLLEKQRDALDASNQALFDQIQAEKARTIAVQDAENMHRAANDSLLQAARDVLDTANQMASAAAAGVDTAKANLRSAYQAQAAVLDDTAKRMRQFAATMTVFRSGMLLGDLSPLTPQQRYEAARASFMDVSSRAKLGDESALTQLQGVSTDFLNTSRAYYASSAQYARDFADVQDALKQASGTADRQADIAERQLEQLRMQVSGLVTINESVLTVAQAIEGLTAALAVSKVADATVAAASGPTSFGYQSAAGATWLESSGMWYDKGGSLVGSTQQIQSAAMNLSATQSAPVAEATIYAEAKRIGMSLADVNNILGKPNGTAEQWAKDHGLPLFADGGIASGMFGAGERGIELMYAPAPVRVLSASDSRAAVIEGGDVSRRMDKLAEHVDQLGYEMVKAQFASAQMVGTEVRSGNARAAADAGRMLYQLQRLVEELAA